MVVELFVMGDARGVDEEEVPVTPPAPVEEEVVAAAIFMGDIDFG